MPCFSLAGGNLPRSLASWKKDLLSWVIHHYDFKTQTNSNHTEKVDPHPRTSFACGQQWGTVVVLFQKCSARLDEVCQVFWWALWRRSLASLSYLRLAFLTESVLCCLHKLRRFWATPLQNFLQFVYESFKRAALFPCLSWATLQCKYTRLMFLGKLPYSWSIWMNKGVLNLLGSRLKMVLPPLLWPWYDTAQIRSTLQCTWFPYHTPRERTSVHPSGWSDGTQALKCWHKH